MTLGQIWNSALIRKVAMRTTKPVALIYDYFYTLSFFWQNEIFKFSTIAHNYKWDILGSFRTACPYGKVIGNAASSESFKIINWIVFILFAGCSSALQTETYRGNEEITASKYRLSRALTTGRGKHTGGRTRTRQRSERFGRNDEKTRKATDEGERSQWRVSFLAKKWSATKSFEHTTTDQISKKSVSLKNCRSEIVFQKWV